MHKTVGQTWLKTMNDDASIPAALSLVTGTLVTGTQRTTPERVEVGLSRMARDNEDLLQIKQYVQSHSPLSFWDAVRLVIPSSGVAANPDDGVNCEEADKIGFRIQQKWDNASYSDISCAKKNQVKTMEHVTMTCSIENENEKMNINPNSPFHRLVIVAEGIQNIRGVSSMN